MLPGRRVLLAAVAAASLLSHLKGLTSPMLDYHYHRQCNTAAIARNFHENGLRILSPQIDWEGPYSGRTATELPLYMWLVGLFWPVLGLGELWGRLLSAAFSAGAAVYLFLFLERKLGRETAFYSGLLFSAIPLEIYFGRTVQPEAIALLGTVGALHHWDLSLEPPRRWADWTLAVLWAFLAIGHKLPYAFVLVPLGALSLLRLGRSALTDARALLAAPLALLGVYAWYRYAGSSGAYVVPSHKKEFLIMLEYARLPYFLWFQFGSRYLELCATYGGLVLIAFGARELWRRGDRFFGAWWLSIAAMLAAGGGYTFHHEYTSLPFAPLNAALMGLGLKRLKDNASGSAAKAGLALLVLSVPVHAALRIPHWYRINERFAFLPGAAAAADAVSARGDLFVCNERASSVYLYYLRRKGWSWDLYEAGEERLGEVEDKIKAGARFYATYKDACFARRDCAFSRWFYERYPVAYDSGGLLIFRLEPRRAPAGAPPKRRPAGPGSAA